MVNSAPDQDASRPYALAEAATDAETERLHAIDRYMAPISEARLARLGVTRGWRCLEVGAGAGGLARWMARRVGPDGAVVATDIKAYLQPDAELPQLTLRLHDIQADALEAGAFDLVHCRLLLANVGPVDAVLRRMTEAVRPGGWLIVEEPGDPRVPGVGEDDPKVEAFNRLNEAFLDAMRTATSRVDLQIFRRLPGLFAKLGLVDVGGEQAQRLTGPEDRRALVDTVRAFGPLLAETAFVRDGGAARLLDLAEDPEMLAFGGTTLALWGRKPA